MQPFATVLAAILSAGLGAVLAYVFGIRRTEYEQRSFRLQERHAEIIAKMHSMLLEIQSGFEQLIEYYQTKEPEKRAEQDKLLSQKLDEFRDYYRLHAVWLDDNMWLRLHKVSEQQRKNRTLLKRPRSSERDGVTQEEVPIEVTQWVTQELPRTMTALKYEFRQILGVKDTSKQQSLEGQAQRRNEVPWAFLGGLLAVSGLCLMYAPFSEITESAKRVDSEFGVTAVVSGLLLGLGTWMVLCQILRNRK